MNLIIMNIGLKQNTPEFFSFFYGRITSIIFIYLVSLKYNTYENYNIIN